MEIIESGIKGLFTLKAKALHDERGFFARTFCKKELAETGFNKDFVQFNHSFNKKAGTLRGMHFQKPPYAETKLIRCVQGAVYDVAVDIRKDSPTFLKWFATELSAENLTSILIPEGFAHGFQAMTDDAVLLYHHTAYYTPGADYGLRFDDPVLKINWPLPPYAVTEKDKNYPLTDTNFKGLDI